VRAAARRLKASRINRDFIVRRGDVTPEGLREKARFVLGTMEARLSALGSTWADTTATQVYTVQDLHTVPGRRESCAAALRTPASPGTTAVRVVELEFEMDCRGVALERTLSA
jgi:enamine deaminase RidA (YjgF/YER057c/UK114 family)